MSASRVAENINPYLRQYDWPGNVRELENLLERIVANLSVNPAPDQLSEILGTLAPELFSETKTTSEEGLVRSKELELVIDAMNKFGGNRAKVAEYLGMSQTTLWRRLKHINN